MLIKSTGKFILTSPKKLREVAYLIKNFSAVTAIERLPFVKKDAAKILRKALMTAVANARDRGLGDEGLVIKEIQIGEGPRLKRFRAGSRGRAKPYKRRMSHIRIVLEGKETKVVKKDEEVTSAKKEETVIKEKPSLKSLFSRKPKKEEK